MGDLELSLDDIIKKKLGKNNANRFKNNGVINKRPQKRLSDQNNRATKNTSVSDKTFPKLRRPISKTARGPTTPTGVVDARLKIIQNQRQKITDAREKLGQIAKVTDARVRLMKLRNRRNFPSAGILRDSSPTGLMMPRPANPYEDELMDYMNDVSYMRRNHPERTASHEEAFNFQYRNRQDLPIIYRTVENDTPPSRLYNQDQGSYSWTRARSPIVIHDDLPDIPVKRLGGRVLQSSNFRSIDKRDESPTWDYDEHPVLVTKKIKPVETMGILKRSPLSGSYHDREMIRTIEDNSPPSSKSRGPMKTLSERFCQDMGSASSQKINLLKTRLKSGESNLKSATERVESPSEPIGHRIVVSNLVPSVTHEDVKELFEDIGQLISSKVVRPGTAEVVYESQEDAVKAVDVYHNRQLDGQPMKCLLVNNRSSLAMASKTSKLSEKKLGKGIELDMTAFLKALHKKSTS